MTAPFDWKELADAVLTARKENVPEYLRYRIEARFVPVETVATVDAALARATARAEAAEAENARLRKGLVGIQNAAALVVENDKPDRVKWDGEWHEGPLATAYIQTLQAIGQLAHSALGGEHE